MWILVVGVVMLWGVGLVDPIWAQAHAPWPSVAQAPEMSERKPEPRQRPTLRDDFAGIPVNWSKLGLSRAQKAQMLKKRREFQVNTAAIREQLKFLEQDLREAIGKDPVDRAAIDQLLQEMTALKLSLSKAAVQNLLEIKGLLTPEQVNTLITFQVQLPPELQALQLTPEQQQRVRDIMRSSIRHNREMSEKLRALRAELQESLLSTVEVDTEKIDEVQEAITEHEMALQKARLEMLLDMREILTPEQQRRYQQLRGRQQSSDPDKPTRPER
jgi:Spy/CpxP family protein refolding chaperone